MARVDMDDASERRECLTIVCFCILAACVGVLLSIESLVAFQAESVRVMDVLVRFDESFDNPFVVTTRTIFFFLFFVGIAVAIVALLGVLGAWRRSKCCVAIYVVGSAVFACIVLMAAVTCGFRRHIFEPVIRAQAKEICDPELFVHLSQHLNCPHADQFKAPKQMCQSICQQKVDDLASLDGCDMLLKICGGTNDYENIDCSALVRSRNWTTPFSGGVNFFPNVCREACDSDVGCAAYMFGWPPDNQCVLTSSLPELHLDSGMTPVEPQDALVYIGYINGYASCSLKKDSLIVERYEHLFFCLDCITIALGVLLAISANLTCCFIYTLNVKREGKPTALGLFWMMMCPCFYEEGKYHSDEEFSDEDGEQGIVAAQPYAGSTQRETYQQFRPQPY